jgi:hypothetical protein
VDRLDGKITEEFWKAKSAEWQQEEQALLTSLRELEQTGKPERVLNRVRILELANKAHSLYVTQTPAEKAKLHRMVLSNCAVDAVSVYLTYRKPFDMIFERAKTKEWWALGDDLRTFEPQSGLPCFTSGIMAGTGGDGRVCKSLTPPKTAIGGQRV